MTCACDELECYALLQDSERPVAAQNHSVEVLVFHSLTIATTLLYCCRYHRGKTCNRIINDRCVLH